MDRIIKFLAHNGKINVVCADTTNLVEKARIIHDLSPVATATLGRVLTVTSIMGQNCKNKKDSVTVQINGNGPIGRIIVTSNSNAIVRGYVENPQVDLPIRDDGKIDVGGAVGNIGRISVIKNIGLKEPYIGISNIISGEIAEDFANYFAISEQNNTAVALGVLVNKYGVKRAGGYIIQAMPDATENIVEIIENNLKNIEPISTMLDKNFSLEEIAKIVTKDDKIKKVGEETKPDYRCNCSRGKMIKGLVSIRKK